jgi:hypothetical protein
MRLIHAVVSLALLGIFGCGSGEEYVKLVPVAGTITQNGKPLGGATVTFVPDSGNRVSTPGYDATGPEGNYRIRFKSRSGISPGKYRVDVVLPPDPEDSSARPEFQNDPYMAQLGNSVARAKKKKSAPAEKTKFDAEVAENGGVFDFDVKTAAK